LSPIGQGADYANETILVGPDGQVWAQQDNQPQADRYPTTFWELRDMVVDRYKLSLREGAPAGQYQLLGNYSGISGNRKNLWAGIRGLEDFYSCFIPKSPNPGEFDATWLAD